MYCQLGKIALERKQLPFPICLQNKGLMKGNLLFNLKIMRHQYVAASALWNWINSSWVWSYFFSQSPPAFIFFFIKLILKIKPPTTSYSPNPSSVYSYNLVTSVVLNLPKLIVQLNSYVFEVPTPNRYWLHPNTRRTWTVWSRNLA